MSNKIRLLPDNWSFQDYWDYISAYRNGSNTEVMRLALKLIASWDYEVDLKQKNAIQKLGVKESADVFRTVMETMADYIENLDITEVEVNFDCWDTEKFFKFDELKRQGKFDKAEPMIAEVVTWDKLEGKAYPYTFTVAATAYKAITEAYKEIISGKN